MINNSFGYFKKAYGLSWTLLLNPLDTSLNQRAEDH
jgi:hypothetical protein